eukprot:1000812-Pelagomonas_calceolata.AAC.1
MLGNSQRALRKDPTVSASANAKSALVSPTIEAQLGATKLMRIRRTVFIFLHLIRKQLIYPEKHKQHIQGNVLRIISNIIAIPGFSRSDHQPPTTLRLKLQASWIGKCYSKSIAKYQANRANNSVDDTGIPGAGPGGNPFPHLFWLAKEKKRGQTAGTSTALAPNPKIAYLPNLQNIIESHLHP